MHCNALKCISKQSSITTLHCFALQRITLVSITMHQNALLAMQSIKMLSIAVQYIALHCNALHYKAKQHYWHYIAWLCMLCIAPNITAQHCQAIALPCIALQSCKTGFISVTCFAAAAAQRIAALFIAQLCFAKDWISRKQLHAPECYALLLSYAKLHLFDHQLQPLLACGSFFRWK